MQRKDYGRVTVVKESQIYTLNKSAAYQPVV